MFGDEASYIEHIDSGERTYIDQSGKGYRVKIWVNTKAGKKPKAETTPGFTRQAKP